MAQAKSQMQCKECRNGAATCNGCRKQYCMNHFLKHRQELAERMDGVGQEHDQLQQDLEREDLASGLISRVENWRQQSINRIEDIAKQAREDLQKWLARLKNHLQESLRRISEQLKSSQTSNNYAEKDLDEWMKQLMELHGMMSRPSTVDITEDDTAQPWIRTIKVIDRSITEQLPVVSKMAMLSNTSKTVSQSSM
ncbi:unnamed protein product [Rotaria magnacalcarata]|uniref:Uncharacterized protein n=1 Tax=Rotaria magnacalcarata TaxID=392030 RepID=A0A817A7L5_9BILA|nr:unnamed protein product [Rotaria magnacalcarata]CAF2155854.1 unnamed protein product [Rotaria magnacalcarata]CAF2258138.1 unnamed protein product [Rotaria magnacalcarata]CAF3930829.1 unnamed protein product [Rotaria magnacalcarata]CAF4145509.1 unnamed protein product [Rotaria magnacalcarata]